MHTTQRHKQCWSALIHFDSLTLQRSTASIIVVVTGRISTQVNETYASGNETDHRPERSGFLDEVYLWPIRRSYHLEHQHTKDTTNTTNRLTHSLRESAIYAEYCQRISSWHPELLIIMPVTKKQGAIFAIYADSPVARTSRSQGTAPDPSDLTPARISKKSTATSTTSISGTTKKRVVGDRKALGALAPAPSSRLVDTTSHDEGKRKGKQQITPATPAEGAENAVVVARSTFGARKLPPRKREVSIATAAKTHGSPTKKTRSTPIKPVITASNFTELLEGSPASRTRSKTTVTETGTETVFEGSPIRPRTTLTPKGLSKLSKLGNVKDISDVNVDIGIDAILGDGRGALNAKSGKSVAALLKSVHQADEDPTDENGASGSTPKTGSGSGCGSKTLSGRLSPEHKEIVDSLKKGGVISKTKGLRVAELLKGKDKENESPSTKSRTTTKPSRSPVGRMFLEGDSLDPVRTQRLLDALSSPRSASQSKSKSASVSLAGKSGSTKKSRTVLADTPLADVSEAYGASGSEPVGFRDIPKCESSFDGMVPISERGFG